jgi:hypothetical protein
MHIKRNSWSKLSFTIIRLFSQFDRSLKSFFWLTEFSKQEQFMQNSPNLCKISVVHNESSHLNVGNAILADEDFHIFFIRKMRWIICQTYFSVQFSCCISNHIKVYWMRLSIKVLSFRSEFPTGRFCPV